MGEVPLYAELLRVQTVLFQEWRPLRAFPGTVNSSEAGSYLRLIDSCITQLKAQGPSRTGNASKEDCQQGSPRAEVFARSDWGFSAVKSTFVGQSTFVAQQTWILRVIQTTRRSASPGEAGLDRDRYDHRHVGGRRVCIPTEAAGRANHFAEM